MTVNKKLKKKTHKKEKSAMSISLYGNLFFVIVEIFMAVYTGSQAVLLDAIYDGIEFFMLLPSVFLIPLLYKPSTEQHPYGYMQLETVFLVIKGMTMASVTIGLITSNIQMVIHGGHHIHFSIVAYFELIACIISVIVVFFLFKKNKNINSPLIKAEITDWSIDSIISFGMTVAFFLPQWIKADWFQAFVPYLDPVITLILSSIMLPIPVKTVVKSFRDLLLIPPENDVVDNIKGILKPLIETCKSEARYSILRTGRKLWINVYIYFSKEEISLKKLKKLTTLCVEELKKEYGNFSFKIIPDLKSQKSPTLTDENKNYYDNSEILTKQNDISVEENANQSNILVEDTNNENKILVEESNIAQGNLKD